jgi:hypothetical protein
VTPTSPRHARARNRHTLRWTALLSALAVPLALLVSVTTGQAATAASVTNPSLEQATNGVPSCWQPNGWGTNTHTFARTTDAHSGTYAEKVSISSYSSGAQRLAVQMGTSGCAPDVSTGHRYSLSGWYKTSGKVQWVGWYLSKSTGSWVFWFNGATVGKTSTWAQSRYTTAAVPSDAARLSFGLSLQSIGTLTVDDFAFADAAATTAPTTATPATSTAPTTAAPSSAAPTSATSTPTSPPATSTAPASTGATWYVSRNGSNADGKSWATGWNELANINWSVVRPGDQILIDGGSSSCGSNYDFASSRPGVACGMQYQTQLAVRASGTATAPITIRLASDAGHNGTAVVFGGRSTMLPYCDQSSYSPTGSARSAGISIPGSSHVVIDGGHRSGIMVYGAQSGVDLASDSTSFVTLRNLELFDNGTYSTWAYGYKSDGEGISLAGHDITIERDLIHDNGQDAIQDRYTGAINNNSHAALYNITVRDSWLYEHREHPQWAGYGFNAGAQTIASQNCTHVDGIQIWGGGLDQKNLTVDHDVFGPFLAQGVYPGDQNLTSFDNVVVSNSLFLNVLDHSIIGDSISSSQSTPGGWKIQNVTSYMTDKPDTGLNSHGKVDLSGSGHSVTNSIFYNGYFASSSAFSTANGNVWWGGDPVPGGTQQQPGFAGPLPTTNAPSYAAVTAMNLTPSCSACSGAGSSLHQAGDLLSRIDSLDATG